MKARKIILQFICPDKAGVLSSATQFLFKRNAFMTEVSSFSVHDTKKFFSRIAFEKEDNIEFAYPTIRYYEEPNQPIKPS